MTIIQGLFMKVTSLSVCFSDTRYKKLVTHVESPSLISLMVSVDVKHHVYLRRITCERSESAWEWRIALYKSNQSYY